MGEKKTALINGHVREIDWADRSDIEVAGRVRMLLRSDLNHEFVCCAARDRIMYLSQENARLREQLARHPQPVDQD